MTTGAPAGTLRAAVAARVPVAIGVLAAAFALAPASAGAAVRHATPGGSGSNPCASSNPCSLAVAATGTGVADGDTVIVHPGTYTLSEQLVITDDIVVTGFTGQQATIRFAPATFDYVVFLNSAGARLSDVRIEATGGFGGALRVGGGQAERVIATAGSSRPACSIPPNSTTVPLRDSVCHHTGGPDGAALSVAVGCSTAFPPSVGTVRVRNVTAVASGAGGVGIRMSVNHCDYEIDARNVIASGTGADVKAVTDSDPESSATITLRHSAFETALEEGPGASVTPAGAVTNITDAPAFVNAAGGDFHQAPGSPTIDAGSFDSGVGSFDLDGELRQQGPEIDIGADEFDSPPDTRIESGPSGTTTATEASFTYSAFPLSEGARFECSLDGEPFAPCPASGVTYTGLAPGPHTFAVRAIDSSDNADPSPATRTWTIAGDSPPGTPPGGTGSPPTSLPANEFRFGKVKRNRRRGTARLTVIVPGPGELALKRTKKVKPKAKRAAAAGRVMLAVRPKRRLKRKLAQKGKAKVRVRVTFTPDGGAPRAAAKKLRLVKG